MDGRQGGQPWPGQQGPYGGPPQGPHPGPQWQGPHGGSPQQGHPQQQGGHPQGRQGYSPQGYPQGQQGHPQQQGYPPQGYPQGQQGYPQGQYGGQRGPAQGYGAQQPGPPGPYGAPPGPQGPYGPPPRARSSRAPLIVTGVVALVVVVAAAALFVVRPWESGGGGGGGGVAAGDSGGGAGAGEPTGKIAWKVPRGPRLDPGISNFLGSWVAGGSAVRADALAITAWETATGKPQWELKPQAGAKFCGASQESAKGVVAVAYGLVVQSTIIKSLKTVDCMGVTLVDLATGKARWQVDLANTYSARTMQRIGGSRPQTMPLAITGGTVVSAFYWSAVGLGLSDGATRWEVKAVPDQGG